MNADSVVRALVESDEPAIRFKIRTGYLGEDPNSASMRTLRRAVADSPRVAALFTRRGRDGRIGGPVYAKWQGAHWILASLADIGYPSGDEALWPIRDQLHAHWLSERFYCEFDASSKNQAYGRDGVPIMQGRHRRCASQQANALWSILTLGIADDRTHDFVERLLHWQWPDGGWNCDKDPKASHSSFMESVLPLRALALYARLFDHAPARTAATRAAEVFLERRLYLRRSDGAVMRGEFAQLHYPLYWHYDILHALRVMAEAGFIRDPRCRPALDLLASKRLPDGGWPAEKKYYRASTAFEHGNDYVDWGGTRRNAANPWITADALYVLEAGGYLH